MTPSRWSVLVSLALVAAGLSWLVVRAEYGSLPALTVYGPVTLVLLAAGELAYAFAVRSRIRRPGGSRRPMEPMFVARLAVLAKASSHMAALVGGLYGGFLAYTLGQLGTPRVNADSRVAGFGLLAAAILVGAALFLEYSCRVPRDPRRDRDHSEPRSSSPIH